MSNKPKPLATFKHTPYVSPLRYPGGKSRAIGQIAPLLPKHAREYREPMVGGGSVFLAVRSLGLADTYWINDLYHDLVVFWRVVQKPSTCQRLCAKLEALRQSFKDADEARTFFVHARNGNSKDNFSRALHLFFLNRVTFSGTTHAGGFSKEASSARFTASSISRLSKMPEALAGVKISQLDFRKVIEAPGDDVFIFLDPPYYTAERLYGPKGRLHEFDHGRLCSVLRKTKHQFLMTCDDCSEIRRLYEWAELRPWTLQYGMNNCNKNRLSKTGAELLISNYPLR